MTDPAPTSTRRTALVVSAVVLASLLAVAVTAVVAMAGRSDGRETHATMPTDPGPIDLDAVSTDIAGHYRFAAAHRAEFEQVTCWCGCEQFLGHRNLADCFMRQDGRGWEAHASGCGVCIGEAAVAARMIRDGHPPGDIARAIDAQFGPTVITVPSTTP